jgi:hypothetical protein
VANNVDHFGYAKIEDLWADRLVPENTPLVLDSVRLRAALYTRELNALLAVLAKRTTMAKERFALPGYGTLQPLDPATGIPLPVVPAGHTDVAYPIYGGGTGAARDRETAALETVEDVFRDQEDAEARDATWLRTHALAALFTPTTRTFVDKILGNLTIQPLAITSDSVTYLRNDGSSSTAQHYVAQSAAIADATNPFPAIFTLLNGYPGNAGRTIVSFIPTANVDAVEALTTFLPVRDPDVQLGSASDVLVGGAPAVARWGDRVLGKVGNVWAAEKSALPSNYLLNLVDGRPPLKMREHPVAALQGFFPEFSVAHGVFPVRNFIRICGFGVANRIAASVNYVGVSGTYAAPSGYTAPQAV